MIEPRRPARYERIHAQLTDLIADKSPSLLAAMATTCAVLHAKMPHHSWTGFYFAAGPNEMHVGPYQGGVACQALEGRGVCLHAAHVEAFPGHIACDARAKSEIVLPILQGEEVVAVLDIDSTRLAQFDEDDVPPLERILSLLQPYL